MSEKPKCPTAIFSSGRYFPHACDRNASYEHEGVMYCKTHHPPTVKAKMDERQKAYRDKSEFEMGRINLLNQAIAVKAEYGLTPRELASQVDQLREALKAIVTSLAEQDDEGMIEHAQQMADARAALANTERKT